IQKLKFWWHNDVYPWGTGWAPAYNPPVTSPGLVIPPTRPGGNFRPVAPSRPQQPVVPSQPVRPPQSVGPAVPFQPSNPVQVPSTGQRPTAPGRH
ncbi:MAG: hypothetical protein NC336_10295, partial [Clostridium sp.]|nr:hypothetical protein [Clostridium sp.]